MLLPLAASPAEAQSHHSSYGQRWAPRYNQGYFGQRWSQPWAQPRTLWQTARSIMPRFADVAYETASSLTVPALALLTLFMVWPEHKHYRSRRDAGADDSEDAKMSELAAHLGKMFAAAVEGDECMQRVACEIGAASSTSLHPRDQKLVERLVTSIAPAKYTTLLNNFKAGVNSKRCEKNTCNAIDFGPDQ